MANWGNVQQGLIGGFNVGQAAGGKMAGIGAAISKVGEMLKEKRVNRQEIEGKQNLLGFAENLRRNAPVSDLEVAKTKQVRADTAQKKGAIYSSLGKKEFNSDVSIAMEQIQGGEDPFKIFQMLSQKYPKDSTWLKRQLIQKSSTAESLDSLLQELQ